jgi:HEAT repeat protein
MEQAMYSKTFFLFIVLSWAPCSLAIAPQELAEEQATIAVRKLWSEDDQVRQEGKRRLLDLGPKAVPQLTELIKSLTLDRRPRFATGKEQEGEKLLERFYELRSDKSVSERMRDFEALNAANIRPRLEADAAELFSELNTEWVLPSLLGLLKWEGFEFSSHDALLTRDWTPSMEALARIGSPAVAPLIKVIETARDEVVLREGDEASTLSEEAIISYSGNIQAKAVMVLGRIGDARALPTLTSLKCAGHGRLCQAIDGSIKNIFEKAK